MELDIYGNPIGTKYPGEEGCPDGMMCIPENEFHMQLEQAGMEYDETSREIQPVGDAEAIIDFTKDLLFLDINMPKISGLTFYKSLQNPPNVIFTTAYSQYAVEGFEVMTVENVIVELGAITEVDTVFFE